MAYTPPASNNIEFAVEGSYTAPTSNDIDFVVGGTPAGNVYVSCEPLITTLSGQTTPVHIIPVAPFELGNSIADSHILMIVPVNPMLEICSINAPDIVLQISLPGLIFTGQISASTATRVQLSPFLSINKLLVQDVYTYPAGYTVVAPPWFETHFDLSNFDISIGVYAPGFSLDFELPDPVLVEAEQAKVFMTPLQIQGQIYTDFNHLLAVPAFISESSMDVYAIKSMPAGDQYSAAPPFIMSMSIPNINTQTQIVMPVTECGLCLSVGTIYAGILADAPAFAITHSMTAQTENIVVLPAITLDLTLSVQAQIIIQSSELSLTNSLSDVVIYDGVSLICPAFSVSGSLVGTVGHIISLPAFNLIQGIHIGILTEGGYTGGISFFISAPAFSLASSMALYSIATLSAENEVDVFPVDPTVIIQKPKADLQYVYYTCSIAGTYFPISAFQVELCDAEYTSSPRACTLQVTIPGIYAATRLVGLVPAVNSGGSYSYMRLNLVLGPGIGNGFVHTILRAPVETITVSEAFNNYNIKLSGRDWQANGNPSSHSISNVVTKKLKKERYTITVAEPPFRVRPRDSVSAGGVRLSVSKVTYAVQATHQGISAVYTIADENYTPVETY